jgi:hypothetical protein
MLDYLIFLAAMWMYLFGAILVWQSENFIDDYPGMRWLAVIGWPVLYPIAVLFGED